MGVLTISLDDKNEILLRETAKFYYGSKKDALSKTIIKGIESLKNNRDFVKENMLVRLNKSALKVKKKNNFLNRSDFYK